MNYQLPCTCHYGDEPYCPRHTPLPGEEVVPAMSDIQPRPTFPLFDSGESDLGRQADEKFGGCMSDTEKVREALERLLAQDSWEKNWVDAARAELDALVADRDRLRDALDDERKRYGGKFNAITAALGHACEAQRLLNEDDVAAACVHVARVVEILVDA